MTLMPVTSTVPLMRSVLAWDERSNASSTSAPGSADRGRAGKVLGKMDKVGRDVEMIELNLRLALAPLARTRAPSPRRGIEPGAVKRKRRGAARP